MAAIQFREVAIRLSRRDVINRASFSVEKGEFIGVLGSNGAGKTTLLRAILGLVPLRSGSIEVFEEPVKRGNKFIGYMPQNRGLFARTQLIGYEIVASAALGGHFGWQRLDRQLRRQIDWALDQVGAQELAKRSISELSGGEQQRLLLSEALLGHPKLLLLDEPLISLDPGQQKNVIETVTRLRDELNLSILLSAHELNPLINVIDRVLYLGRTEALLGSVEEIITGPVLSRLYGADIEVVRVKDRVFVMLGDVEVESKHHCHDHHSPLVRNEMHNV